jgi:hypothetical protein
MYNNIMYTVATYLVEQKTGQSFSDFLEDRFFRPLGMHSTSLQPSLAREKGLGDRIAAGHFWIEEKDEYKAFENPSTPEAQGAGSIVTSVNDYIKWVKALMNQEDPITKAVYDGMIKPRTLADTDYNDLKPFTSPELYATGLYVFHYRGHMVVGHGGAIDGFGSSLFFLPEFNFGAVLMENSSASCDFCEILMRILIDEVVQVPELERPDWNQLMGENNNDDLWKEEKEKVRQQLCPGIEESQPQQTALAAYTGTYHNKGYHNLTVQIKDDKLFIDAFDRYLTLSFEHVCDQTKFIVYINGPHKQENEPVRAEFVFEDERAVKMGIHFALEIEDLIWFERV